MKKAISPISKFAIAAIVCAAATYQASAGSFTYDLRAVSITGGGSVVNRKQVEGVVIGTTVTFDIVAVIKGDNVLDTDEGFQFSHFGVLTSGAATAIGGALGSAFNGSNVPTAGFAGSGLFAAGPNQGGTIGVDVTGDGAADIGPLASNTTAANFAKARATAMVYLGNAISTGFGITAGVGREYTIGTISYRVTSLNDLVNSTTVNLSSPTALGITVKANWQFDSLTGALSTNGIVNATGVTISAVPEPSAFGMVMLGALGLVGFRRLGLRRTA